jgi:hypothetical protein
MVMFSAEIGDLYVRHGSIAIAVYGRRQDARSGALSIYRSARNRLATGVRMIGLHRGPGQVTD